MVTSGADQIMQESCYAPCSPTSCLVAPVFPFASYFVALHQRCDFLHSAVALSVFTRLFSAAYVACRALLAPCPSCRFIRSSGTRSPKSPMLCSDGKCVPLSANLLRLLVGDPAPGTTTARSVPGYIGNRFFRAPAASLQRPRFATCFADFASSVLGVVISAQNLARGRPPDACMRRRLTMRSGSPSAAHQTPVPGSNPFVS
jgi:hypothetical protein